MAHTQQTVNLGAGAGKTLDLGAEYNYADIAAIGGEMWYRLSTGTSAPADPAATPAPAAGSVASGWMRLDAATGKTHGVNGGGAPVLKVRFIEVWAVGAGTLSVAASSV